MPSGAWGSYPLRAFVSSVSPAATVTSQTYGHFSFVIWTNPSHGGRNMRGNDNFIELATLGQFSSISVLLNECWLCRFFSLEFHYFNDSDLKLWQRYSSDSYLSIHVTVFSRIECQWLHFSISKFWWKGHRVEFEEMCVLIMVLSNTSSGILHRLCLVQALVFPLCL